MTDPYGDTPSAFTAPALPGSGSDSGLRTTPAQHATAHAALVV